jgi:hypothetical protein
MVFEEYFGGSSTEALAKVRPATRNEVALRYPLQVLVSRGAPLRAFRFYRWPMPVHSLSSARNLIQKKGMGILGWKILIAIFL